MKVTLWEGEIRQGSEWASFDGKVMIDGSVYYAEAEADDRGLIWKLTPMFGNEESRRQGTQEIGPGAESNPELEELLMDQLDNLGTLGWEVLKTDLNVHESNILTVRMGHVVGGHNIPNLLIEGVENTFGPAWAR